MTVCAKHVRLCFSVKTLAKRCVRFSRH